MAEINVIVKKEEKTDPSFPEDENLQVKDTPRHNDGVYDPRPGRSPADLPVIHVAQPNAHDSHTICGTPFAISDTDGLGD